MIGTDHIVVRNISSDNCGRRKGEDRRQFSYTIHIPERRNGSDRRKERDRRLKIRNLNQD